MKVSKVKLVLFELVNNSIIKDIYNKDIISIDMNTDGFIGIIGDNGSGKSTIMNEMSPVALYGQYIEGLIGRKHLVYENNKYIFDLEYIFEPNGEKHSCKGYFKITDKDTGITEDCNPTGSFDGMNKLVEVYLGVNKNILQLFNLTHKNIFLVDMTTGERLEYIQNLLPSLKEMKKESANLNSKILVLNKVIKSNENKLSRMNTKEYISDSISDIDDTIKSLEKQLVEINKQKDQYDEILSKIRNNKSEIEFLELNMRKNTDIVGYMGSDSLSDVIGEDSSIKGTLELMENNMEYIGLEILDLEKKLNKIEVDLNQIQNRDNITIDFTDNEFEILEDMFMNISKEEIEKISTYDEQSLNFCLKYLEHMNVVSERYKVADIDIRYVIEMSDRISNDSSYFLKLMYHMRERILDLEKVKEDVVNSLVKMKVVTDILNKNNFVKQDICNSCVILKELNNISDDVDILVSKIDSTTKEINEIEIEMRETETAYNLAKSYLNERDKYDNIEYAIKMYIEDFEFIEYIRKPHMIDDAKSMINYMITTKRNYITYKRIKEINRLNKKIDESEVSYDSLKENQNFIVEELKRVYEKKKGYSTVIDNINKIIIKYGLDCNELYLPKRALRDNANNIKNEIKKKHSQILEYEAVIETLSIDSLISLNERLTKEKTYRDKLVSDLTLRDSLVSEIGKFTSLKMELDAVYLSVSVSLVRKVVKWFMVNLRDYSNKLLSERQLPYRIGKILITDKEFRIPVLNELTGREVKDISKLSSGEKALVGTSFVFASHNLLDIVYDTMNLDEVDALLADHNRRKYIENLMSLVDRERKQVIAISHNGNFSMYGDISLIAMRGAIKNNSNKLIYDAVV